MIMVSYICLSFCSVKSSSIYIIWETKRIDWLIDYVMKYHTSKYLVKKILHVFETEDHVEIKKDALFQSRYF